MQIKSISELTETKLSTVNAINTPDTFFIECSISEKGQYESYKIDFAKFCKNLVDQLTEIKNRCTSIESNIGNIKETYVKKAGDTMTGSLTFKDAAESNVLVLHDGKTGKINSTTNNHKFGNYVQINDGVLKCSNDIAGCALSAKWC